MPKIEQLSAHEAQKIAAGQVIERPADIIKELIENSIDAQATAITLLVEQAGIASIRVIDNGCGMDVQDAKRCFDKHATSKLRSMHELQSIETFGFRGEAMPSIAAVCKVTLTTRMAGAHEAIRVSVQENTIISVDTVSAPVGTDIIASDLFYTIPVRKKFLKKQETEWRHIVQLMQAFALAHVSIHFKIIADGKEVHNWPPVDSILNRCIQLWDGTHARRMLPVAMAKQSARLQIVGAISDHQQYRFDRSGIFIFVNNRWIKNSKLINAYIAGYTNVLPQGRYPTGCLALTIDPLLIDINIHPRKEEVRFEHPLVIEQCIKQAIKERLEQHLSECTKQPVILASHAHRYQAEFSAHPAHTMPMSIAPKKPFEQLQSIDAVLNQAPFVPDASVSFAQLLAAPTVQETPALAHSDTQIPIAHDYLPNEDARETTPERAYTLIGQYNKTYLLLQAETGLVLVDQHAAHERILYEKFLQKFDDAAIVSLLFAQRITMTESDFQQLIAYLPLLHEVGIGIEEFGHNQFKITALPVYAKDINMQELLQQMVGWIIESLGAQPSQLSERLMEKLRAQMACKAAVKAGDILTHAQMVQLVDDLEKTHNRLTCPHGRPTSWLIDLHDIEKKFKRRT